mmetsp:Transcript_69814/g.227121  ORF Transcript_69814/g.227121 Transcript_69814/m.227121 type:complete len:804 (-) Transcript_69814:148-2559(-)|eukprot:CAMPEP_0203907702 /NCGR_PEP_ID=MMETSP0359-20131031/49173_1 /ASSEMBLY_ACC=CAM_ASM_000338 /TAXON_ID=268821 /ORGANISM="Scrippsiella Hangoei, Strain SHTV-5" /LENGTH=803 /DNA_ID=CAMNT_0050832561 /DNA_START=61 /DNA_END=2472 /DNA_ORIENTATION=+
MAAPERRNLSRSAVEFIHKILSEGSREAVGNRQSQDSELKKAIETIKKDSMRIDDCMTKKPWMRGDTLIWHRYRVAVAKVMLCQSFESFMSLIILGNIVLMWIETDLDARCFPLRGWSAQDCPLAANKNPYIFWLNRILLIVYSLEICGRIYVERRMYIYNKWNWLDFGVVCTGLCAELLDGILRLTFLRAFRLARLFRAARVLLAVRELYLLMTGLTNSMKTIFYGTLFLIAVLLMFSIIVVQLLHPINAELSYGGCERCSRGFASVWDSSLTLFQQVVAGDSWGTISIPVIEAKPWLAGPILLTVITTVGTGLMNLILAVIVERASEACEQDVLNRAKHKDKDRLKTRIDLATLCANLDEDGSGTLSLDELLAGYDGSEKFQSIMRVMDVQREDIQGLFRNLQYQEDGLIDTEDDGAINYMQFCEKLNSVQSRNNRMMILEITSMLTEFKHDFSKFKKEQSAHNKLTIGHQARMHIAFDKLSRKLTADAFPSDQGASSISSKIRDLGRLDAASDASVDGPLLPPPSCMPLLKGPEPVQPPLRVLLFPGLAGDQLVPRTTAAATPYAAVAMAAGDAAHDGGPVDNAEQPGGGSAALAPALASLQEALEALHRQKVELLKRIQGQVGLLSSQSQQLASISDALQSPLPIQGPSVSPKSSPGGAPPSIGEDALGLDRIREQVLEISSNIHGLKAKQWEAMSIGMDEEREDMLLLNGVLVGALAGDLGVQPRRRNRSHGSFGARRPGGTTPTSTTPRSTGPSGTGLNEEWIAVGVAGLPSNFSSAVSFNSNRFDSSASAGTLNAI